MYRGALRHRPGRTIALFLAVLIAATGFTVLTASSSSSRLAVVGAVDARARLNYDILVRPVGSKTPVERDRSLVQAGYLSGVGGGISRRQWHQIEDLPDIDVAAPIAMVGYVVPRVAIPVDVGQVVRGAGRTGTDDAVVRLDVTWRYDNGLSAEPAVPDFAFLTGRHLAYNLGPEPYAFHYGARTSSTLIGPDVMVDTLGLSESDRPSFMSLCSADGSGSSTCGRTGSGVGPAITFPFPMLLAAIDPATEAQLSGLGAALASGTPLPSASLESRHTVTGKVTPVLAAARPATELQAHVRLSRVEGDAVARVLRGAGAAQLRRLPRFDTVEVAIDGNDAYERLLRDFGTVPRHRDPADSRWDPNAVSQRFVIDTPKFRDDDGVLVPQKVENEVTDELREQGFSGWAPAGIGDVAVRRAESVEGPEGSGGLPTPATVHVVGTLPADPAARLTDDTSRILSGVTATSTTGADDATRQLLGDVPLAPSPDVPGLVQPPPLMITTLDATDQWYRGWGSADPVRPISAIRVRVAGVTGIDEVSRERVRLAAQRIRQDTGLDVDITLGASATDVRIQNPPGRFGRPRLELVQQWVEKGVATSIVKALDRKSLAIFVLLLLVSALTVANAVIASVRARRTEFGVLACLGWTRRQIAGLVLTEVAILAVLAGLVSVIASLLIGELVGTAVSLQRALLALPAALVVALAACLVPVWQAGRSTPLGAVHAAVPTPRRSVTVRSLPVLALVNVGRNKVRTLLGAGGLTVAIAAATFLAIVTLAFRGAVVGTVLGDAVAVDVRAADYAAVAATLLLALVGVVTVMYLNIRERGVELATLASIGWSAATLNRVITYEALVIGALGTASGIAIGAGGAAIVFDRAPVGSLLLTVALSVAVGLAITLLAAAGAGHLVRRIPITAVLAEE